MAVEQPVEELGKVCMDLDFLSSFDPRIVSVPVMVIWQLALFAGGLLLVTLLTRHTYHQIKRFRERPTLPPMAIRLPGGVGVEIKKGGSNRR